MKQIGSILVYVILVFFAPSCRDHMGNDSIVGASYADPKEAFAAVEQLYSIGSPSFYGKIRQNEGPAVALGGMLSGLFTHEAIDEVPLYNAAQNLALDQSNAGEYIARVWSEAYAAIVLSNQALERIPNTEGLSADEQTQLMGQAAFFRAFNYFYLVRWFGEVPLLLSSTQKIDQSDLPRASLGAIYQTIVGDLKNASASLTDTAFVANGYRITRPTAQTLLSDVYLTMSGSPLQSNNYAAAAELARQVIQSKKHSLITHGGTPDSSAYNLLRTQNDTPECIYCYCPGPHSTDQSMATMSFSRNASAWGVLKTAQITNVYAPQKSLLDIYDKDEDMRAQEQQFFHTFFMFDRGGRTVIETFEPTSYMWFDRAAMTQTGVSNKNITIYRYAELLLIAAESIARSEGVTPEAIGYLVDVRSRALTKQDRATIIAFLSGLNVERFVEEVWIERLREFPFEMKVWTDMLRTRRYPMVSTTRSDEVTFVDLIGATTPHGAKFTENNLLLPSF